MRDESGLTLLEDSMRYCIPNRAFEHRVLHLDQICKLLVADLAINRDIFRNVKCVYDIKKVLCRLVMDEYVRSDGRDEFVHTRSFKRSILRGPTIRSSSSSVASMSIVRISSISSGYWCSFHWSSSNERGGRPFSVR